MSSTKAKSLTIPWRQQVMRSWQNVRRWVEVLSLEGRPSSVLPQPLIQRLKIYTCTISPFCTCSQWERPGCEHLREMGYRKKWGSHSTLSILWYKVPSVWAHFYLMQFVFSVPTRWWAIVCHEREQWLLCKGTGIVVSQKIFNEHNYWLMKSTYIKQ